MKLIIKHYLSSLRERGELDAVLPDLLSQMGLNVYSRPKRGTRQDGVDVAAVGRIDGAEEYIYLFSLKPGNLTRRDWDSDAVQSLRPSLNEILDSYIPNRIPPEHQHKKIVICIGIGGDVEEQVRSQLTGFTRQSTSERVSFQEWNGDKIAALIESNLLSENLLPAGARSSLRKSLAMLDEPDTSYQHFAYLIKALAGESDNQHPRLQRLRQMSICLWIHFAWTREANNLDATYRAAELTLLHAWELSKSCVGGTTAVSVAAQQAFFSVFHTYFLVTTAFIETTVLRYVGIRHGISSAIRTSNALDVNLKLFDIVGRLAMLGLWTRWLMDQAGESGPADIAGQHNVSVYSKAIQQMIRNNPALLLPIKDEQAIDISIAMLFIGGYAESAQYISEWMVALIERALFAFETHGCYPCTLRLYADLLLHPTSRDDDYRQSVTEGSILYPMISLWAALDGHAELYEAVKGFKKEHLGHCNLQLWFPDETSEKLLYTNQGRHGSILSEIGVEQSPQALLDQVFGECDRSPHGHSLSAISYGWWPLILVACRHYRLPVPVFLFRPATVSSADKAVR